MKKYPVALFGGVLSIAALTPLFAHAAPINCRNVVVISDIASFLCVSGDVIDFTTGVLGALALLVFFWGLVKYIAKADDEKAKESGKNIMIWGVIALFVMFSIFGLVNFLQNSFGTTGDNTIEVPKLYD